MNLFRVGRAPKDPPVEPAHPLMQAHVDTTLPYWVVTDHAIWGAHADHLDAVTHADHVATVEVRGERVLVTFRGIVYYTTTGHHPTNLRSYAPPL